MKMIAFMGLSLVATLVLSCHKEPEPLVPAAGTIRAIDGAIDDVSKARCEYELRCNHVGAEMHYSDHEHCMNVMRSDARQQFNQCHAGVDQSDLRECLTQIGNEECTGAFRRLEEYKECHLDNLCE